MKRWLSELIRRAGSDRADLPSLGIAALSAAAILAAAVASAVPAPFSLGVPI